MKRLSERLGYPLPLLDEVERVNEEAVEAVAAKVEEALWNLEGKRIALLGLAFKAGTDDVRFSPALALARRLLASGAVVVGYDPRAASNAKEDLPELELDGATLRRAAKIASIRRRFCSGVDRRASVLISARSSSLTSSPGAPVGAAIASR